MRPTEIRPILTLVTGPPGAGKTTLAHRLARTLPCPAICRDEIKEGLAYRATDYIPEPGDELTRQASQAFFSTLHLLLRAGVTVVAEAAFQSHGWLPHLPDLGPLADLRIIRCHTDTQTALKRVGERTKGRGAHADTAFLNSLDAKTGLADEFDYLEIDAPTIDVDTTDNYRPTVNTVTGFIKVGRIDEPPAGVKNGHG